MLFSGSFRLPVWAFIAIGAACAPSVEETASERRYRLALEKGADVLSACRWERCAELVLNGAALEDYSQLNEMQYVTRLFIDDQYFPSLNEISGMQQLTYLSVNSARLTNLDGLDSFPNLVGLWASGRFGDVSDTLSGMNNLRTLELFGASENLAFVEALTQLRTLHIEGGQVLELAPLRDHPTLEVINFERVGLPDDLDPLLQMPALRELRLGPAFSDGPGRRRDDDAFTETLRAQGVVVEIFPGHFDPEVIEPTVEALGG